MNCYGSWKLTKISWHFCQNCLCQSHEFWEKMSEVGQRLRIQCLTELEPQQCVSLQARGNCAFTRTLSHPMPMQQVD